MNRKTKMTAAAIAAVLLIVTVVTALIVRNSIVEEEGFILSAGGKKTVISFAGLDRISFSGEIVNGKGEITDHEYRGIELYELLKENGIEVSENTKVTAAAEDNYTAEIKGNEIMTAGKVYIAVGCDGEMIKGIEGRPGAQLVVYGDPDSKRQVRNLKSAAVE